VTADELARILDDLGERLGPTGERVFELTIRYVITDAIVGLVFGVVILTTLFLLWRWGIHRVAALSDNDREFATVMGGVIGGGISLLVGAYALYLIGTNAVRLLNPEFAALQKLVEAVKP
jgi:zinc transporter ZupT